MTTRATLAALLVLLSALIRPVASRGLAAWVPIAITTAITVAAPTQAWACSCGMRSPCSKFGAADAVFLGQVVDVRRDGRDNVVRVQVTRTWRGTVDSTVTVREEAGTSCSFDVKIGQRFLVYGHGRGSMFSTHMCAGSAVLPDGDPEPDLPPRAGRVTGLVVRFNDAFTSHDDIAAPVADTRVSVQTGAGVIETRTDANGWFTLDGVPVGKHTVQADLGRALEGTDDIVLNSADDCARAFITPRPSGRISGQLTSEASIPLKDTEIHAVPLGHDWSTSDLSDIARTTAGENGAFEFSGLKAGKYYLTVNVLTPPRVRQPYPPTYYPGVENPREAIPVEIHDGSAPPLAPFHLNRTLPRTTIPVDIVCRDGSVPRSGIVSAKAAEGGSAFHEPTYTKANGHFQVALLSGVTYDIYGEVPVPGRDRNGREIQLWGVRTPEVRFDPATPPPVIRLIAPLEGCGESTVDGSRRR